MDAIWVGTQYPGPQPRTRCGATFGGDPTRDFDGRGRDLLDEGCAKAFQSAGLTGNYPRRVSNLQQIARHVQQTNCCDLFLCGHANSTLMASYIGAQDKLELRFGDESFWKQIGSIFQNRGCADCVIWLTGCNTATDLGQLAKLVRATNCRICGTSQCLDPKNFDIQPFEFTTCVKMDPIRHHWFPFYIIKYVPIRPRFRCVDKSGIPLTDYTKETAGTAIW